MTLSNPPVIAVWKSSKSRPTGKLRAWLALSRLPFHTVGVLPFVLGGVLAWRLGGAFRWEVLAWGITDVVLVMLATY